MPGNTVAKKGAAVVRGRKQTFNIDAEFAEEFPNGDDVPVVEVGPLYGETFKLIATPNIFGILRFQSDPEDASALYHFIINAVHESDRKRFITTLSRQADLTDAKLGYLMRRMLEAIAAPNPTTTPTASISTSKRTTTKALSAES